MGNRGCQLCIRERRECQGCGRCFTELLSLFLLPCVVIRFFTDFIPFTIFTNVPLHSSVLNRIGPSDPAAAALAHELITALTRSPLDADDIDSELDPDMAAVTIRLVARELAHESPPPPPSSPILPPPVKGIWAGAPGTLAMSATSTASADGFDGDGVSSQHCTRQHTWLGVDLLRIVEMVVGLRMLTEGEQVAIWELALRRKG